jgi:hypothetical protein
MKTEVLKSERGAVLLAAVVITLILTILGISVLSIANSEIVQARKDVNRIKAFYLAEAGVERLIANINCGASGSIGETALGCGSYSVDFNTAGIEPIAVATGTVGGETRRVQVTVSYLIPPYECGIYAGGLGGIAWTLMLRGTGNPTSLSGGEYGGKDKVNGNIFVDGNVAMYEQSSVNPAPTPNTYGLAGDVNATGSIDLYDSASVSGDVIEGSEPEELPDLIGMNYAVNNTHNVPQIFADAGVTHGALPSGNPLRDVFQINPSNMTAECATTAGNDYFFTCNGGFQGGDWKTAPTPLNAGVNRVYYVDGDVWVHSKSTFGFTLNGKVTIVATGNIHLCDNMVYANSSSMLGLVALGKYDSSGQLISGGNIYFGDPVYGTLYTFSAMMFAANSFLYNTDPITATSAEPTSGFTITGNLSAMNKVSIERDWYTKVSGSTSTRRPARYDSVTGQWLDSRTGTVLTSTEIGTMKHYQMIINYDERVRNRGTQPPSLPKGVGYVFGGITNWKELP